ncbi:MAG TPA: cytochrome c oxidase subunit 3 [Gaiellaceae bacterium]|nr:cytochrome c oxidase subunit 3 [Gaiellaceae bacterium]
MTTAAEAHDHHGPPPIHYSSRVTPAVLGMFLFIGSEIMLFGSFFTVYFFDRIVNHSFGGQWPPPGYHRPAFVAGVNTLILITSSFTMHWADSSIKKGNRAGMQAGLMLTVLLGLTFLLTQVVEYHRLGFNTSNTSFAATFFGLTGLHACHVFVGLAILAVMTTRAFRGHFSPEHHHGIEIGGIYWHFVDVMWIVVYVTVYLL